MANESPHVLAWHRLRNCPAVAGAMGANSTSFAKAGEVRPGEIPPRSVFTFWGMGMNPFTATPRRPAWTMFCRNRSGHWNRSSGKTTFFTGLHSVTGGHSSSHCFLTGVDPHRGRYGISCDQVIAERLEGRTRFPVLALSCTRQTGFGGVGDGTLSWTRNRTPVTPEDRPQVVFDRLFRPIAGRHRRAPATCRGTAQRAGWRARRRRAECSSVSASPIGRGWTSTWFRFGT